MQAPFKTFDASSKLQKRKKNGKTENKGTRRGKGKENMNRGNAIIRSNRQTPNSIVSGILFLFVYRKKAEMVFLSEKAKAITNLLLSAVKRNS